MNLPSLQFPLLALALLALALVVLNIMNGAPIWVYAAFVPALLWAGIILWRGRAISRPMLNPRGRRDNAKGRR